MQKIILLLAVFLLPAPQPAAAQENFAGSVKNVQGTAHVIHQGMQIRLQKDMKIYQLDTIVTGKDGSCGIILQDNTVFSMGSETKLALEEFVFSPDESHFSLLVKMIKGTFVYVFGIIGKLSPESIHLETPVGTIAIRGTRFAANLPERGSDPS